MRIDETRNEKLSFTEAKNLYGIGGNIMLEKERLDGGICGKRGIERSNCTDYALIVDIYQSVRELFIRMEVERGYYRARNE